jgi:hypothetical protein
MTDSSGRIASATPLLFDVVGVNIKNSAERFIGRGLTEKDADALVMLAVMCRGIDAEVFKAVPAKEPK